MLLHKNFKKILILFLIFYGSSGSVSSGDKHHHRNISLFNKNICKDGGAARVYYTSSHRVSRLNHNPYQVVAKDILRKYIYIVNVVVIYIILYSL